MSLSTNDPLLSQIKAAARECFAGEKSVDVYRFITALQSRNVETRKKLTRIVESTDYLALNSNNTVVSLTRDIFATDKTPQHPSPPPSPIYPNSDRVAAAALLENPPETEVRHSSMAITPVSIRCDTAAIAELLDDIEYFDLEDIALTDIFLDVGSRASAKVQGKCIEYDKFIEHSDVDTILERLPGEKPADSRSNRVIFGKTLHRLAAVTYDGAITGITIRVGRNVSGLLPIFQGLVENKSVLLCGPPNVGKTTTLREICKYLAQGKCLCLIDTSGEVCGDSGLKRQVVGTSRVFRPMKPEMQYETLLDCVRNHSPDVIAIDELNTKKEMEVCQTIALRSIQMVAALHGNIQDLVFNPMLNKALGGTMQTIVSDRVAVDGRKVVSQRTTRPIFDVVINIKKSPEGFKYRFIEDTADNVTRIMQDKPIKIRTRHIVDDMLFEVEEELPYPYD
ncbi:hypothetical protein BGZ73_008733 [Actinomortierella ambigua]|nr:hypothetical protein BGZ73_008733 [Actinomortierella ambigua]